MGGELTADLAKAFGSDKQQGAFVNQVMPHSAADNAGIKPGDIIVKLNGKAVRSFGELRANIATMGAGKTVTLGVIRDGKEQEVSVTLKQADLTETKASVLHPALEGATLGNSEPSANISGVVITKLEPRSAAAQAGLQKGDVIIGVNRTRITTLQELQTAMKSRGDILALNIRRGDATLYLVLR
jgi:serine protease DegQ